MPVLLYCLSSEQSFAVGPGGFAYRVAEETGKGGQGGESELKGDIG